MLTAAAEILTTRTLLRHLREADFPAFASMNANLKVMRYFPQPWTVEESRAVFDQVNTDFDQRGFGVYALEVDTQFAGVVGLSVPEFQSWFTPCVEILWRLQPEFWCRGLATEAAAAVLKMAAESLSLETIYSFAVVQNLPSLRVMQKIGMSPSAPAHFDHPAVEDPALRRHLLYGITLR